MSWIITGTDETGEPIYAEVQETRRVTVKALTAQINELQAQKAAMIEPTRDELVEHGRAFHPYYQDRQRIQDEIDNLKILRDQLRLM